MIEVPKPIRQSEYRKEIDEMLMAGDSYTAVSNWLRNHGEVITRNVISKYHRFCFNVNDTAAALYTEEQSKQRLEDAAKTQVSTLLLYDKLIEAGAKIDPTLIDQRAALDLSLKAAKQREDFLREHGDQEAEQQTQLLKEIRDELIKGSLEDLIKGLSDERTKKRIQDATE
jgi:hypothetical protein